MEIVELLNGEIETALHDAKLRHVFTDLGAIAFEGTPAEFGRHLAHESEKWGKVVEFAGIKAALDVGVLGKQRWRGTRASTGA